MGLTPVENYYIDSGWGTWGFKATPVCGKRMAETRRHRPAAGPAQAVRARSLRTISIRSAKRARPRSGIESHAHEDHELPAQRPAQHLRIRLGAARSRPCPIPPARRSRMGRAISSSRTTSPASSTNGGAMRRPTSGSSPSATRLTDEILCDHDVAADYVRRNANRDRMSARRACRRTAGDCCIDRTQPVSIQLRRRAASTGFSGDIVASALMAIGTPRCSRARSNITGRAAS